MPPLSALLIIIIINNLCEMSDRVLLKCRDGRCRRRDRRLRDAVI